MSSLLVDYGNPANEIRGFYYRDYKHVFEDIQKKAKKYFERGSHDNCYVLVFLWEYMKSKEMIAKSNVMEDLEHLVEKGMPQIGLKPHVAKNRLIEIVEGENNYRTGRHINIKIGDNEYFKTNERDPFSKNSSSYTLSEKGCERAFELLQGKPSLKAIRDFINETELGDSHVL